MKRSIWFKIVKYAFLVLTIFINLYIIMSGFMDGKNSSIQSGKVATAIETVVNTIKEGTINDSNRPSFISGVRDWVGHYGSSLISGVLTTITIHLFLIDTKLKNFFISVGFSAVWGVLLAFTSEHAQFFANDRYVDHADIQRDLFGYFCGLLLIIIILIIVLIVRYIKRNKKQA